METQCITCGAYISAGRWSLGYKTCLDCGELEAQQKTIKSIVPLHKSNYIPVFSVDDLVGINNKGGLVK